MLVISGPEVDTPRRHTHSAETRLRIREARRGRDPWVSQPRWCECCGEYMGVFPTHRRKRYCDNTCAARAHWKTRHHGRYVACPGCGDEHYVKPSHEAAPGWTGRCRKCWHLADSVRENFKVAAARREAAYASEIEQLAESGFITVDDLAAELRLTPRGARRMVKMGRVAGRLGGPAGRPRLLIPRDELHRFRRALALTAERHPELLDPEHVVRMGDQLGWLEKRALSRGLSVVETATLVRAEVEARRRVIMPHARGRKPSAAIPAHHLDWAERFVELRGYYDSRECAGDAPVSDGVIYVEIALEDYAHESERWSYDPGSLKHNARTRVRKAIKPLLTRETGNSAA